MHQRFFVPLRLHRSIGAWHLNASLHPPPDLASSLYPHVIPTASCSILLPRRSISSTTAVGQNRSVRHGPAPQRCDPAATASTSDTLQAQLDQSLKSLTIKSLTPLLTVMGLPLSGTKTTLMKRLSRHLHAIAAQAAADHDLWPETGAGAGTGANIDGQQEGLGMKEDAAGRRQQIERIKGRLLPQSIISIDIGIRNLAWIELSKNGEILRWAVEDLLLPGDAEKDKDNNDSSAMDVTAAREASLKSSLLLRTTTTATDDDPGDASSISTSSPVVPEAGRTKRKVARMKKPPPEPFEQRSMALRIDKVMRKILFERCPSASSPSPGAVIIERQRFRTGGMHTVLDATFKCGVIEGMIHAWLVVWEQNERRRRAPSSQDVMIESISPRAVGQWWGVGSAAVNNGAPPQREELRISTVEEAATVIHPGMETPEYESDHISSTTRNPLFETTHKTTCKYQAKKRHSKTLVDSWIRHPEISPDPHDETAMTTLSLRPFQVWCRSEIREWYCQERKRDDLSDCLLQAMAWFEWRERAIVEAVERSGIVRRAEAQVDSNSSG